MLICEKCDCPLDDGYCPSCEIRLHPKALITESELTVLRAKAELGEALEFIESYVSVQGEFAGEVHILQWTTGEFRVCLTDDEMSPDASGKTLVEALLAAKAAIEKGGA